MSQCYNDEWVNTINLVQLCDPCLIYPVFYNAVFSHLHAFIWKEDKDNACLFKVLSVTGDQ